MSTGTAASTVSNVSDTLFVSPTWVDAFVGQMFNAALGHLPTWTTLSSMVSSGLTDVQLAIAIVSSQAFADTNNGGIPVDPNGPVNSSVVDSLFQHTLGHLPTQATLEGFEGMTNEQAFYAFATSDTVSNATGVTVNNFVMTNYVNVVEIEGTPLQLLGISPENVHFFLNLSA